MLKHLMPTLITESGCLNALRNLALFSGLDVCRFNLQVISLLSKFMKKEKLYFIWKGLLIYFHGTEYIVKSSKTPQLDSEF